MRFGIFDHMEHRGESLAALYEERLQMLERADQAGFWCYHKAEHHFIGLDAAPSSTLFLAAAAQRTRRLRLGPLVFLLPFYHPLRLLEEICALDQLCAGRLEVGVGKGISPVEHRLWGNDPQQAAERFEEVFAIVRQGLRGARLSFAGRHYRYHDVPVVMRPYRAGPGFWYAGNAVYAGRHRLSTVLSGPLDRLREACRQHRSLCAEAAGSDDWNSPGVSPVFAVKRHLYLADTDAAARERAARAYPAYHENLAKLWKLHRVPFPTIDPSFGGDMHAAMQAQDLVVGAPETVASHLAEVAEQVDTDYLIGAFAWGDLTHPEVMRSLELFIGEVMPRFAAAPHSGSSTASTSAQNTRSSLPARSGSSGTST